VIVEREETFLVMPSSTLALPMDLYVLDKTPRQDYYHNKASHEAKVERGSVFVNTFNQQCYEV
jgi:hypothetical protein